ncbi:transcriptional antiterminator, BglG family [Clostridium cavendishii DSM 21758]|uniref:Transcriptional antiterminator, BglG family n=1 Tax=Clostridium cavendishii DSM 21758 TaxID=1121302 RepID=A0A1M6GPR3_9CLOT|nr:PRD domain-containing protein [Clostridium cavendishii]SHJ11985.1 transcriptional antiterminator, BglG family [Clostridium cavendishii DSM 21758]
MIIHKILNNNVVVILDENKEEQVVMGRGLAFKKRVGDEIDEGIVDKVFSLSDKNMTNKLQELLKDMPLEYVELSDEIIKYAKLKLEKRLSDNLIISLSDHIQTAVERHLEGINMKNVLLWDIKRFYKDEFAVGLEGLKIISDKLKVDLPEDEAGFIAIHIANSLMDETITNMYDITKVIQEILNIVKYTLNITFDEESVYFYRFVTHIKFFAQRLVTGKTFDEESDDSLLNIIKEKYQESYKCVNKIGEFIYKKYSYIISDEEKLYLTIHIARILSKQTN